ncbi:MAG: thiamine pyrophosphate-dependent enzyme [Gammaproteobacteria bacterium]|jgi:thiamine pyrophosphate-dependent acetolactate synthase large subunit-like protein|nr:thiamine pyrophosphate-dependent enzyme [Gammaproteobacteria bacterium]
MMQRRTVVAALLENRPADMVVVSSLGNPTWDVASVGDHALNFNFIGAMGQAGPFALGLAMARPEKRIVLFAGDGELLMSLGVLATIANQAPANLAVVALDNESYVETGSQPSATAGPTDLEAVARACGFVHTRAVVDETPLDDIRVMVWEGEGPLFVNIKIVAEALPLVFPYSFDGAMAMNRFRGAVNDSGKG